MNFNPCSTDALGNLRFSCNWQYREAGKLGNESVHHWSQAQNSASVRNFLETFWVHAAETGYPTDFGAGKGECSKKD